VAATKSGVDYVSAPKDYSELFQIYYLYLVNLVNQFGIDENNKEDVASEILARFYERGFLEKFDPTLSFSYMGELRPARFKNFLSKFALRYVRGHVDKQRRIATREVQICDRLVDPDGTTFNGINSGVRWVDLYGATHDGHEDTVLDLLTEEHLAQGLRQYLSTVPKRSTSDRCDLVKLFDAVRVQVLSTGTYDIALLKDEFGCSPTAMHTWIWWLKEHLAHATGLPVPPKRRRTTKAKLSES
jgi:hypothetical protein